MPARSNGLRRTSRPTTSAYFPGLLSNPPLTGHWKHWPTSAQRQLLREIHLQLQEPEETKPDEWYKCRDSLAYFIANHVVIFNATLKRWIPFDLWPAQRELLPTIEADRYQIVLKARQLGLTWLCLAYLLWRMIFYPAATVGLWSKTEDEAKDLLDVRLKGMWARLPEWARGGAALIDNKSDWMLANGSRAMAFATTGGRSYTFSNGLVDEADYQPDLGNLLSAVEPTVNAGGQLILISSSNKDEPVSPFKAIYEAALVGESNYRHIFLPWSARPERDQAWYERQKRTSFAETGSHDTLYGEYPETPQQALAARQIDKRIPIEWLEKVYLPLSPLTLDALKLDSRIPALPNLEIYRKRRRTRHYVIGVDPAEGNPTSDASALTVMDEETGEEVAALAGRFQPEIIAEYAHQLGVYYNHAALLAERNNHGHTVISWWRQNSSLKILRGPDKKRGWLNSPKGKVELYDQITTATRDEDMLLHSSATFKQLQSIDGTSLSAPEGMHDDRADACALAHVARALAAKQRERDPRPTSFSVQA